MDDPSLDGPASPEVLRALRDSGAIDGPRFGAALSRALAPPTADAWRRFLSVALACLGAVQLLAGVIFFFAFNWQDLTRFHKLGLLELTIVMCAGAGLSRAPAALSGRLLTTSAAVLVGPLLAVFGQTYQTGADAWQLFALWAGLVIPWSLGAAWAAGWCVQIALIDGAAVLYWDQMLPRQATWHGDLFLLLASVHLLGFAALQVPRLRAGTWQAAWLDRALAATAVGWLSVPAVLLIGDGLSRGAVPWRLIGLVALTGVVGWTWWRHRRVRADLYLLTSAVGATCLVLGTAVGRLLFDALRVDEAGFFFMGIFIIGEVAVAAWFLRREASRGAET